MTCDVLVVGSGASGGWACKRLAEAGLHVVLLEAGRPQMDRNFTEHEPPFALKYRNLARDVIRRTRPIQSHACNEFNYEWFCNDLEEPYSTPPNQPFLWLGRLRMTGGRTNVWGRACFRLSDLDFKAASFDGYGEDWPLSYKDLAPYYDLVENYVGVTGLAERLDQLPDGRFQPPMPLTCQELEMRSRVKSKLGWTVTLTRSANLTRSINGRAPCHYCGPCERGCVTHSYFNSAFTTVADALASGHCTLVSNAMAYQVVMDQQRNRATGVLYIDRNTREMHEIHARAVVLCAQAQESVRILFNSATASHDTGLANSSGVLGRYLMAHVMGGGAIGELPDPLPAPRINGPNRPVGTYAIRFRNTHGTSRSKDFLRGYGLEIDSSTDFSSSAPGFGPAYKNALLRPQGQIQVQGFGECLPRPENRLEIDRNLVDTYGIPALTIHMADGDNEVALSHDMARSAGELLEAAGARNVTLRSRPSAPRWAIHEVGVARMGADPRKSVLNQFQQTHDVPNLFVMDGSGFVSSACQNPTLTIMALCVRSCDYMMAEMKRHTF